MRIVMSDLPASVSCSNCGHEFEDYDAANAVDAAGRRILACPDCGGLGRADERPLAAALTAGLTVRARMKSKARQAGEKKPFKEVEGGASHYRATDEWHDVQRTINRENNWYDEVVTDAAGNVVREV